MIPDDFDPDGIGIANGNYFGLPFTPEQSALVLVSVPWDVTTSYGGGASFAPDAIIEASTQVDLYDVHHPGGWKKGIGTVGIDYSIQDRSAFLRPEARCVINHLEQGDDPTTEALRRKVARINEASEVLNEEVYRECARWIAVGKTVGLVGGDHSTPLGAIRAAAEKHPGVGVLHIDAHADLRERYEGFEYSHASIMYNVMTIVPGIGKLVQVGLRDMCDAEVEFAAADPRIAQFTDYAINDELFRGADWNAVCERIVAALPADVYISFDIDGLSPDLCPHTGTPVPGGITFHQAVYLLDAVARSGRRIVGFDLTEVSPDRDSEWDANVGARMLYKLCNITLKTGS
ncbi:MAG: agmatinase family protein [Rikenellaceae bacterium]|jgi:agmatinase|nr:agmatinase family protein [Rikenellaceae bacterium]